MIQQIAVETLTLSEVSEIFQKSYDKAYPKFNGALFYKTKQIKKAKIKNHKWVKTYEEFKGAKLNFYCEFDIKLVQPIVAVGMTHRRSEGLILICFDQSNGGIPFNINSNSSSSKKWFRIYTGHFCERYAERIMKAETSKFENGSEGLMFSDIFGPVKVTDTISNGLDEIEFQFTEGQAYGYRDSNSNIVYLKTVYSNEMLKGDRKKFWEEWKEPLNQIQDLFKWH